MRGSSADRVPLDLRASEPDEPHHAGAQIAPYEPRQIDADVSRSWPNVARFPLRMFMRIAAYGVQTGDGGGSARIADYACELAVAAEFELST